MTTPSAIRNRPGRLATAIAVVATVWVGLTATAGAHVGITSATTSPDGATTIDFGFDHGCGSSATIALEMQLPAGATLVSANLIEGWSLTGSGPVVRAEGTPVPDGVPGGFALVVTGYDTSVDHIVPTVQLCEQGEQAWIDPDQASPNAAPLLTATTPGVPPTAPPQVDPVPISAEATDAGVPANDVAVTTSYVAESSHSHVPWAAIIAGVAGVAVVAAAVVVVLSRSRRNVSA
jgi:uncharacterized protein YcnI